MAPTAVSPPSSALSSTSTISTPKPKGILSRKRSSLSPTSSGSQPASQKRVRLAIEPNIVDLSEAFDDDAADIREELIYALAHCDGEGRKNYENFKQRFDEPLDSDEPVPVTRLRACLLALINHAPLLNKSHSDLVHTVLRHPWLRRDELFVSLFTRFLGHLVSSHPGYQFPVFKMLVENFAHVSSSAGHYPNLAGPSRQTMYSRIHEALRYLLQLVPSAGTTLSITLPASFPYSTDSTKSHVHYVRNLLRITEYAPELKSVVLDLIVEKLLKIDVQVQDDVEQLQEDVEDILMAGQPEQRAAHLNAHNENDNDDEYELSDDEDEDDDDDDDNDDIDPEERRLKSLKAAVEKMDVILDILFTYFDPVISPTSASNPLSSRSTFNQLVSQFRKQILPTYRSRHTQFLLFHFAQTSSELSYSFANSCIHNLTDRSTSNYIRVSAAAYVASFVARGSHVGTDVVLHVFRSLSRYSDQLRGSHEPKCNGPVLRKYEPYYATIQALLYIFCFRWRDLLARPSHTLEDEASDSEIDDDGQQNSYVRTRAGSRNHHQNNDDELDAELLDGTRPTLFLPLAKDAFIRNFNSTMNPLKVCAPEIVQQFAKIAHHLSFMYIYPILEANKRVHLTHNFGHNQPYRPMGSTSTSPSTTPSTSTPTTPIGAKQADIASLMTLARRESSLSILSSERNSQLAAYFPFDPYRLPLSKRWVVDEYREWKGVPGLKENTFAENETLGGESSPLPGSKGVSNTEQNHSDQDSEDEEDEEEQ